jgi:hypothetical protein
MLEHVRGGRHVSPAIADRQPIAVRKHAQAGVSASQLGIPARLIPVLDHGREPPNNAAILPARLQPACCSAHHACQPVAWSNMDDDPGVLPTETSLSGQMRA